MQTSHFDYTQTGTVHVGHPIASGGLSTIYAHPSRGNILIKETCIGKPVLNGSRHTSIKVSGKSFDLSRTQTKLFGMCWTEHLTLSGPLSREFFARCYETRMILSADSLYVYQAIERVPSQTLGQWRKTPHSAKDVAKALLYVVNGIEHAHAMGTTHGDLSFGNILYGPTNSRLIDLANARNTYHLHPAVPVALRRFMTEYKRICDEDASEGISTGTLLFMDPLVLSRQELPGFRSDKYAVGVLAFDLLTGQNPILLAHPEHNDALAVTALSMNERDYEAGLVRVFNQVEEVLREDYGAVERIAQATLPGALREAMSPSRNLDPLKRTLEAIVQVAPDVIIEPPFSRRPFMVQEPHAMPPPVESVARIEPDQDPFSLH